MDKHYSLLLETLQEESIVMERLVGFGRDEVDALRDDDIPGIRSAVKSQETEIERFLSLEEQRAGLLAKIQELEPAKQDPRIEEQLTREGNRLAVLLQELAEVNETNRLLAEQALSFAGMVQQALTEVVGGYDKEGQRTEAPNVTTIDRSV